MCVEVDNMIMLINTKILHWILKHSETKYHRILSPIRSRPTFFYFDDLSKSKIPTLSLVARSLFVVLLLWLLMINMCRNIIVFDTKHQYSVKHQTIDNLYSNRLLIQNNRFSAVLINVLAFLHFCTTTQSGSPIFVFCCSFFRFNLEFLFFEHCSFHNSWFIWKWLLLTWCTACWGLSGYSSFILSFGQFAFSVINYSTVIYEVNINISFAPRWNLDNGKEGRVK